ncbi:MAG: DUF362 domain-containing protein [Verrucomicrobiota bacterium]
MVKRRLFISILAVSLACLAGAESKPAKAKTPSRSRVIQVQETDAVQTFVPQADKAKVMVARAITQLTGKTNAADAWKAIVSPKDKVGIKVHCAPGPTSGTRAVVVGAVIEGLLSAGLKPGQIIVWDRKMEDLRAANYGELEHRYGIRLASSTEAGYDEKAFYDTSLLGNLVYGDLEFGKKGDGIGRKSYVSKLVTRELTKIISITPLLNHNQVGVTGHLYGLTQGSVDNFLRFDVSTDRLATAVPEIYALPELSDRLVLAIVDALICQYHGEERGLLHYSTVLNQLWFSKDPVALDVLGIQELEKQRKILGLPLAKPKMELYENATLLELGQHEPRLMQVETPR